MTMPAFSLAAAPGRRRQTIDLAKTIEQKGYSAIFCPSFGDAIGFAEAILLATSRIVVGTGIVNLYMRHPADMAATSAFLHEVSDGRFRLGVGISHAPQNDRLGVKYGKPLEDMRAFVTGLKAALGEQPGSPIIVAALRKKMTALAGELGDGVVYANACRSHLPESLSVIPAEKRGDFFVGNMTPFCVSDDRPAALAALRRYLYTYFTLPNYQNFFIEAGYGEEVERAKAALAAGNREGVAEAISERIVDDMSVWGTPAQCREGVESFVAAGLTYPILVPVSTSGGQMKAFEEAIPVFTG